VKLDTASEIYIYDTMMICLKSEDRGTPVSSQIESLGQHIDMKQTERDLVEQADRLNMREDYIAWK